MHDLFLYSILLAAILSIVYGKLRKHIKALENQIYAQGQSYKKLREANQLLQEELKRIESRIDLPLAQTQRECAPVVEAEPTGMPPPAEPESAVPPPLPRAAAVETLQPAPVWKDTEQPPAQIEPAAPSLLSRIPWRDILKQMHLLPPEKSESGESAESQLAAWWVIRIGLVLLIIAAVFFGIYVSQHTPAWLRVLTLALVSTGTIVLGSRMSGKMEGFGRAIIGGGFALLYFTAFAAFALPATKIINFPAVGVLAQTAALLIAILWSLWKRDQTVATLTLFLGFVSCGFSHSHDLDRFTLIGLMLLAATGSFLFATRGWLTAFITSLAGSWIAFGAFTLLDWHHGNPASFVRLTSALVILTTLFEAGNLACAARGLLPAGDRLRRWLVLSNTSAAALLGYGVTRLVHPDQLSTFYFVFAALYFTFTAIHRFRTADQAVTESLFLKCSALLCLGFAAAFSGPVRWLAIAFQAFSLLWISRRNGSRWIAAGFVVVLAASVGWFWHDLTTTSSTEWRWMDTFRIAGFAYLIFLTAQLGFHSRWFPGGIGGTGTIHENQAQGFRIAGSLIIGLSAFALAFHPMLPNRCDPVWFMFLLSVAIGVLTPLMRSAVPCFAASLPLLASYAAYAVLSRRASQATGALLLGVILVITSFAVAEAIRRYWPDGRKGKLFTRSFALLIGFVTVIPFFAALCGRLSLSANAALAVFALLFPAIACAAIFSRQRATPSGQRTRSSIAFQIAIGLLILIGCAGHCSDSVYVPSALALAGIPILSLAKSVRARNIALACTLPILGGFFTLWASLLAPPAGTLMRDSINLAVLLAVAIGLAWLLWKQIKARRLKKAATWADAVVHGLAIFSIHLYFQRYLDAGPAFLADAMLGIGLLAISRRFPFRVLGFLSWLPVTLACLSRVLDGIFWGCDGGEIWFWASGLTVLGHLLLVRFLRGNEDSPDPLEITAREIPSFIAVLAWSLIVLAASKNPWQSAALTGVALLSSSLWRWGRIPRIGQIGLAPLTLAAGLAAAAMLPNSSIPEAPTRVLTSVLLSAVGFIANGIIMASAVRCILEKKITHRSVLPWFHAGIGLFLVFWVCTIDRLVSGNLTAVFWGLSSIILFVNGLFAGLRAYRLTGLIGLVFCVTHIFIWDIQDTFYRIIAFFVIGLVMLAIGYLYHRFRERISALDH